VRSLHMYLPQAGDIRTMEGRKDRVDSLGGVFRRLEKHRPREEPARGSGVEQDDRADAH
jgi:hypothetical protein